MEVNDFVIPDSTIDEIKAVSKDSFWIGKERGFKLCRWPQDPDKNLVPGTKCTGDFCSIDTEQSLCLGKNVDAGSFHTHPKSDSGTSSGDILHTIQQTVNQGKRVDCQYGEKDKTLRPSGTKGKICQELLRSKTFKGDGLQTKNPEYTKKPEFKVQIPVEPQWKGVASLHTGFRAKRLEYAEPKIDRVTAKGAVIK